MQQGYQHFNEAGCNQCHVENWKTGQAADRPELSNQQIRPFTDLLLHDMGEAWRITGRNIWPTVKNGVQRHFGESA
ncbi:di-heme oxidoredictase family protein [Oceanospirillum sp. HFRX-1_2]